MFSFYFSFFEVVQNVLSRVCIQLLGVGVCFQHFSKTGSNVVTQICTHFE